jgi:hypothetical protein
MSTPQAHPLGTSEPTPKKSKWLPSEVAAAVGLVVGVVLASTDPVVAVVVVARTQAV